jgi:hypothetical protein
MGTSFLSMGPRLPATSHDHGQKTSVTDATQTADIPRRRSGISCLEQKTGYLANPNRMIRNNPDRPAHESIHVSLTSINDVPGPSLLGFA